MSAPESPARRSLASRLLFPVAVTACLGGGIAAGTVFLTKPEPEPVAEAEPPEPVVHHAPEPSRDAVEDAVRSQQFEKALTLLAGQTKADDKGDPSAILRGLALEGAGKFADAVAAYRLAADPDRDPATWAAAGLGAARAALANGDTATAREWLARVELRSGLPACRATRVADECRMLRARLDVAKLPPPPDPDPLDDAAAVAVPFELTGPYLDWLTAEWRVPPDDSLDAPPPPAPLAAGLRVAKGKDSPVVSGLLPETRVTEVLSELARAAGWKLRLPGELPSALTGAAVAVGVSEMPIADVLVALTEPLGLRWQLADGTLSILTVDPAAEPDPTPAAVNSLTRAADCHDHPHARAAAVRLATLYEKLGRTDDATARYARILTDTPHAPEAVHAGYNLGLLQLRGGHPEAARSTFQEVIDRGGKSHWTDLGWWWTGRTYLDECDPASAFKPLRAALAGKDRSARSAATLGLALCHILQGNDAGAYQTLSRHILAAADPHARLGRLFGEFLRHATTPTTGRAESLYAAVGAADGGRRLGPAGTYLAGQVYRDLGLTARTVALYEAAVAAGGPWASRMTLAVGEILDDEDRLDEARQRLLAVAAVDTGSLGRRAETRLADLELRAGRPDDALTRCQRLIDRPDADESAVLYLMGRAYEAVGDPLRAAACFAGRRPTD